MVQTLTDMLPDIRRLGKREAVRWSNGFRTWIASYTELYGRIGAAIEYFDQRGVRKGDRVLIWAENRLEWVAVFWACVARGIEAGRPKIDDQRLPFSRLFGGIYFRRNFIVHCAGILLAHGGLAVAVVDLNLVYVHHFDAGIGVFRHHELQFQDAIAKNRLRRQIHAWTDAD